MTTTLFIGGILAIGTAGACIAANVLRKLSENTADDNADALRAVEWGEG